MRTSLFVEIRDGCGREHLMDLNAIVHVYQDEFGDSPHLYFMTAAGAQWGISMSMAEFKKLLPPEWLP